MKNFSKMLGISVICALSCLGVVTQASTGDTATGSVSGTGTTITYTGSLLTYLNSQEKIVNSLFTTSYAKVYSAFTKTGLNIMKSVDYQSLVCLGAIKNDSLLSQIQKDKTALTISFKKDFIDLENQVVSLEEKQDLQESDNVNVFDAGTTYESEKAKLKDLIDAKVKLHQGFLTNFETNYLAKNTEFLTTYLQYSTANKDLVKAIQDKMTKVQGVIDAFSGVETIVTKINSKVTGLDELIKKMDDTKSKGLKSLDTTLQSLVDTNIKKYKKLQTLASELSKQKAYVIGQYQMDFDEYLTNNLQSRYNRSSFVTLKNDVAKYKAKYYTPTNQMNCSSILSTTDESAAILARITTMKIAVGSGLAKIESDGISATFKDQLFSGFQSLYIQKFKQRYAEYTNYIKEYVKTALKNFVASVAPVSNIPQTTPTPRVSEKISTVVFTKPFTSNQYSPDIKALQNTLTTLGLYTGAIDGIYNKATKNGVYQFQLSKGLLVGYEKKPETWGWMGPATRAALNNLTK